VVFGKKVNNFNLYIFKVKKDKEKEEEVFDDYNWFNEQGI
jgi:hypothetical protein